MITVRRALAAGVVAAAAIGLVGCTTGAESEPGDSLDTTATSGVAVSGTAPIVFAFVCDVGTSDRSETYTTYSAVWDDERTDCRAQRITGTEMSTQQRSAVDAAEGDATLEELATTCAVRGTGPWAASVDSSAEAHVAAGLLEYCPGHPETEHLRDAIAAWRG
ncbi:MULTISPECIES: hypothetical protein [unclassified Curtobacterium]|uniref:hypothetical protein n=1 Tax=unclassified Curtobacterium TaxID=257496 RepID=UPI00089E0A60|nr:MULTISPECIES: hypothetical protein [unclassified Curtobacterium]AOX67017.1 hypothetical protein BJK06_15965 [Curtobacterium sp. BH-2-1-1]MCC8907168.1 hypothetical protein [Curtobacterium sp. GD1]MCT9621949.1 hypothetical protein [Curtobacterium sp. C2H10]MDR6171348.1 hypothetical protein [Curtobacterium sp. SORGH_AS_0776]OII25304.1 hypothetical protein BIV03_08765 [Curtobacterium sp. MCBA15_016]